MFYRSLLHRINPLSLTAFLIIPVLARSQTINQYPNLPLANSSVAIADLDNDGFLDIILVSNSSSISGGGLPAPPVECIGEGTDTLIAGKWGAKKKDTMVLGPFLPPGGLPRDRGLWVHVLDGFTNYSTELSPNHDGLNTSWPRQIANSGGCSNSTHPTVAIKDIAFSGSLAVVVGGADAMYAFRTYGANLPGFAAYARFPPFFNAAALRNGKIRGESPPGFFPPEATTVDGSAAIIGDDDSTYRQRWNGLGKWRQCQWMGDFVYSSPGSGDTGRLGSQLADGVPDEVGAADGTYAPPNKVFVSDSLGKSTACDDQPPPDQLFSLGGGVYSSSVGLGDLDGDHTQDIAIQHPEPKLELFRSNNGSGDRLEYPLASGVTKIGRSGYSSPAIVNLSSDPAGAYDRIVVTSDGGIVYAFRYSTNPADCAPNPACLKIVWQSPTLDSGAAISASPIVVKLRNDDGGRPQVVVANDAGKVYILRGSDGTVMASFGPLGGATDDKAAVWSTPAAWTRKVDPTRNPCQDDGALPTNCPIIVTGNRYGTFEIVLTGYPPFNPDPADPATVLATQWPTFHRSNTRTGALVPAQDQSKDSDPVNTHNRGSIGGVADASCQLTHVKVYQHDGTTPANDYYTGNPTDEDFLSDGRFLFELLPAKDPANSYKLRFNNNPANDVDAPVDAGFMTRANRSNCSAPP